MIPTSQEFIDAMRAKVVTTSARVDVIDNEYNSGIMVENGNYAIFEGEGIELDGSRCIISEELLSAYTPLQNVTEEETQSEGWYSTEMSDENGNIDTSYSKFINHSKKDRGDLHVLFSRTREEYAIDFSITVAGNTTTYTDNAQKEVIIENVSKGDVTIRITKWSKANSRAKILNVYLGTVFQYEDVDIVSINCKKGVDLLDEEIQTKEIEIKLVDKDNAYNIFDEDTELTSLDNDARIIIHIGVLIGNFIYYVKTDECYFNKIEKQDNELEMTIRGMGIISKYENTKWTDVIENIVRRSYTLQQIKSKIEYSLPNLAERMKIDDYINEQITEIELYIDKNKGMRDFFKDVIIPFYGNIIETYDNRILFKHIQNESPVSVINLENMENNPEIKKNDSKYNVFVKKYGYTLTSEQEKVYSGTFQTLVNNKAVRLSFINQDDFIAVDNYSFTLNLYNQNGTVYKSNITQNEGDIDNGITVTPFSDRIEVYARGNYSNKKAVLTVNAKRFEITDNDSRNQDYSTIDDDVVVDSRCVQDDNKIALIKNWIEENILKKYEYKMKLNDTCTYELGDTVQIETGIYSNNEMIVKNAIVVGIEYEYKGYLDYYLILKGA